MSQNGDPAPEPLSPLESRVMDIVWRREAATAEDVLAELGGGLSNASVRTLLRRIERKGYLRHRVAGRAFVYEPVVAAGAAAASALERLLRRFYRGSAEQLVQGLLDGRLIDRRKLETLARRVRGGTSRRRRGAP